MFLINKEADKKVVYDTQDGVIEPVESSDIDAALSLGYRIENIDGKYNLDSKLCTRIIYGANENNQRTTAAYLSYECTIVYKKGTMYILYGDKNPLRKGISQILLWEEADGFVIRSRTKYEIVEVRQECLDENTCLIWDMKDLVDKPQVLLEKENYLLHLLQNSKVMNRVHRSVMTKLQMG